jgi:hypothetical protein
MLLLIHNIHSSINLNSLELLEQSYDTYKEEKVSILNNFINNGENIRNINSLFINKIIFFSF